MPALRASLVPPRRTRANALRRLQNALLEDGAEKEAQMTHIVLCDGCNGAGCGKCDFHGAIVMRELARSTRTTLGAVIWYGLLGVLTGLFIVWLIRGGR